MRGIPLKKEEVKEFVLLYKNGESTRSIAKKFNRCHSIILWHFERLGIKRRERKEAAKLGVIRGRIKIFKHKIPESAKQMSLDKAYILGVLCGDGYINYNKDKRAYQIGLDVTNKEFFNKFRRCLYKVYKIRPTNEYKIIKIKNWQNKYITRLCSKAACEDLLKYGELKTENWKIPKIIKKSDLNIQAIFLKGLYDSEGDVDKSCKRIGLTSINGTGLDEVKNVLNNFNIRCTIIIQKDLKPNRKTRYVLRVQDRKSVETFYRFINFTIKYKKENLKQIINNYKLWTTPKEEILKLRPLMTKFRNEGLSYEEIAKRLNVCVATVWNHLQKINLKNS